MTTATVNYDSTTDTNALTITLASLASSSTAVAGRQSTVVSNATTKFMDVLLSGQITVGTTPTTAKSINIYAFAPIKIAASTATYPTATATALGETDAAATFEAEQLYNLRLVASLTNNATSDRVYVLEPTALAQLFGGVMPIKWGIFVTHSTGVALNATAGNHFLHYTGIKYDAA